MTVVPRNAEVFEYAERISAAGHYINFGLREFRNWVILIVDRDPMSLLKHRT